jgi:hypothetical protein
MINKFYDTTKTMADIPSALDSVFTPAEVMESLCMHFRNVDAAIAHLVEKIGTKKRAEMERLTGTVIADLVESPFIEELPVNKKENELVSMPPTLVLSDTNDLFGDKITAGDETVGADTKRVNDLLKQGDGEELREFTFGGIQWKCATCKGGPSQSCATCKPQLDIVQKKIFASMDNALPTTASLASDALGGFACAFFEETPFLDSGGWMPGQNPGAIKSEMDLNMLS